MSEFIRFRPEEVKKNADDVTEPVSLESVLYREVFNLL